MLGAEPDEIVVSEAARPFLTRDFDLEPTEGPRERVYRLGAGERPARAPRRMASFVGRRHELELLRSRIDLAIRGHGQVVGILGEPGIGKSRLLAEFRQSLPADLRLTCLEGHCHAYTSTIPYAPVLDILRQNFRITEGDLPEEITQKVRLGLAEVLMDPEEWAPYLLRLFGVKEGTERLEALTPSALKFRTFEALRQITLNGALRRPILFVVEDLNWIDTTSEECFASLMESAAGAPAALFATYRPGYRPPWMDKSYATQVALQPLSAGESLSVVQSVLRRDDVPQSVARLMLDKAEGNPFFLEELARAIRETGELRPPVAVPDTIEEVLLTRIDRLPDEAKRLLQTAAVLGRQAPLPLLRALWDGPGDVEPHLRELVRLEFLYTTSGGVEPTSAFTHTLTREIAYESLPLDRRHALHRAAGAALERAYADRLDEIADRLAYHYARTDEPAKAVEYLTRLAATAARGHAHTEAVRILEEARDHVARLAPAEQDRRLVELCLVEAYSLIPLGRFQEILDLLARHHAHIARLQDAGAAAQYHFLVGRSHLFLGDDDRASHHARAGIAEATRSGDEATLGKIHYVLAQQGAMAGHPHEGLAHGREAIALLGRANETWWVGPAYWALGLNHALLGDFGPALAAEAEAATRGEAAGDPQVQSSAAWATGVIRTWMGEWDAGIAACERARALSPDPLNSVLALGWLGYAHLEKGEAAVAIPLLTQSVELLEEFHFPQPRSWFTAYLGEAYRVGGDHARARDLAVQALAGAREVGSIHGIGVAERALGRLALAGADPAEARAHLGAAGEAFRAMGARYDVARTELDLAAAADAAGDRDATPRHLTEARALFRTLAVPRYVERTERLAAELGVELAPAATA
jgi:tetratricopeptide (TPR) repeat protein